MLFSLFSLETGVYFIYFYYLLLFFLGAASRLLAGAGVRLVTDQSYCRPPGPLLYFWRRYRGWGFLYAITEELHAGIFVP